MEEIYFLNDGTYELDSGAYFGIVPKVLWSKYISDNNNKIRITTNIPFLRVNDKNILVDAGIGNNFSDRFRRIFVPEKNNDIADSLENDYHIKGVDNIILSHMHFDHNGHIFSGNKLFRNSQIIMQEKELKAFRHPNDFTRGSYIPGKIHGKIKTIEGSRKITGNITAINTGGHTEGHMVIFFEINSKKYMYGGDLFPSSFHLKPYYITAIDSYPIETLKMKKKLLKKAINENISIIFNHDNKNIMGKVYGSAEKPEIEFGNP
ncbi:MBL fold metallo-hydrolase [Ferroplasma acidiphilum]|uniref:MBL fold metallo-hydrolase n=1 Tax=Ferroplasma acidiphilum TaxID=74969 RepID=A0A7K4FMS1_9ARCH|nr:MBL fold metallo-hydrolase [Ferroplasma acidiphilum]NOL60334.1 MBL fold metallo-hydrolase [Ferroplasma acidiphilum]WMT53976.1 MAG: MBL fold metallo-hydrolase [Ferroplasma acidiphilum]